MIKIYSIILAFTVLVTSSCINKLMNKDDKRTSEIILGYRSSPSPVMNLSIQLMSVTLIDKKNTVHTIHVDKSLQLAIDKPQFLTNFTIPSGTYKTIRFHLSLNKSVLTVFNPILNNWIEAKMLTVNELSIPDEVSDFHVEHTLSNDQGVEIKSNQALLMEITFDMKSVLTQDLLDDDLVIFQPSFYLASSNQLAIKGTVKAVDKRHLTIELDNHRTLKAEFNNITLNHKTTSADNMDTLIGYPLEATVEYSSDNKLNIIDNSLNIIDGNQYKGWLYRQDETLSLVGFHSSSETHNTFVQSVVLPENTGTLKAFNALDEIGIESLRGGQAVTLYHLGNLFAVYLEPTNIIGKITENEAGFALLQPLLIDGKHNPLFDVRKLKIRKKDQDKQVPNNSFLQLSHFYFGTEDLSMDHYFDSEDYRLNTSESYSLMPIDDNDISLLINFKGASGNTLFFDESDTGDINFFITEALKETKVTATFRDIHLESDHRFINIQATSDTHFRLSYIEDDTIINENFYLFFHFIKKVSSLVNPHQQKFASIACNGIADGDHLLIKSLHMSLRHPLIDNGGSTLSKPDMISDIHLLSTEESSEIVKNKIVIKSQDSIDTD